MINLKISIKLMVEIKKFQFSICMQIYKKKKEKSSKAIVTSIKTEEKLLKYKSLVSRNVFKLKLR